MKTPLIALIVVIATQLFPTNSDLSLFRDRLQAALSAKDISALEQCFYWNGTPQPIRQSILKEFKDILLENEFLGMYFFTPDSKNINPLTITTYCSGRTIDGAYYKSNLPLQYICTISFKNPIKKSDSGTVKFVGIGLAPDGSNLIAGTLREPEK